MFIRIISGGQTGVDRAALDFAMTHGIPTGGWCPKGRKADDGPIALHYPLHETPKSDYRQRTFWNMRDCDGALIFHRGTLTGGTLLTVQLARSMKRPHRLINLNRHVDLVELREWLHAQHFRDLNIAGPRERGNRGIHAQTIAFLEDLQKEEQVWIPLEAIQNLHPSPISPEILHPGAWMPGLPGKI